MGEDPLEVVHSTSELVPKISTFEGESVGDIVDSERKAQQAAKISKNKSAG